MSFALSPTWSMSFSMLSLIHLKNRASFEFFIRHMDGTPINSEAEKERVIQCLQASIQRRASQGTGIHCQVLGTTLFEGIPLRCMNKVCFSCKVIRSLLHHL